jgi:fructose-1,6-bisphosphatase I
LLYECNPLSFVVEQAGGKSVTSQLNRILDIEPTELHQRATIAIGSPEMVEEMQEFVQRYSPVGS